MPGYVKDALLEFQHPTPTIPHHSLHQWTAPQYGSTAPRTAHPTDDALALNPDESNTVKQLVRNFLYYSRAVDLSMIVALNTITAQQSKVTQETAGKVM